MASVVSVASHILDRLGSVSTMKLQKLVFYSQALSLVQTGRSLFPDEIQAWRNGPVVPSLYQKHAHEFVISSGFVDTEPVLPLESVEVRIVDHVVDKLQTWTGQDLSQLTHSEQPWQAARVGVAPTQRSRNIISTESIKAFYGSSACENPVFC